MPGTMSVPTHDVNALAERVGVYIQQELPRVLTQLVSDFTTLSGQQLHIECTLQSDRSKDKGQPQTRSLLRVDLGHQSSVLHGNDASKESRVRQHPSSQDDDVRPMKRRATGGVTIARPTEPSSDCSQSDQRIFPPKRKTKRLPDIPTFQPSTAEKFVRGVWDSIFSGISMDPLVVMRSWEAIESSGQPRLLVDAQGEVVAQTGSATRKAFTEINVLARKISHTSRACRSLEVIVQAHWVQAFDNRITELTDDMTKEKAKKTAIAEACSDFGWTEKELRNRIAIWKGYADIKAAGGWAALVFAGAGLYRFCKYRVSFGEETFQMLKALRHRFEVAADTLHPRWRQLLAIVGAPTERMYHGHPHDWVVCGPGDEAIPLPITYHQWDKDFSYTHIAECSLDEEAWGQFDPRLIFRAADESSTKCQNCGEAQSDDPRQNSCACYPDLYGCTKAGSQPVQVFRTPNGKNNGLLACCAFESGAVIGEFIGQITSGIELKDVMIGKGQETYQIWQGRQGNFTRFVNHSCQPNSQFENFVWLGKQRIVLVSKGIDAGEEITVDYSDTYWKDLDKKCLCEQPNCRYRNRTKPSTTRRLEAESK